MSRLIFLYARIVLYGQHRVGPKEKFLPILRMVDNPYELSLHVLVSSIPSSKGQRNRLSKARNHKQHTKTDQ